MSARFYGEYRHTIDKKGRMSIPAKFREALGENFMYCKGPGKYLRIYTLEAWAEEEAKIDEYVDKAETNRDEARRSAREIYRSVADGELDAMGRTLVPMALREYAGIDDRMDMVIIGSGKFIEVWPEATWNEYYETEASKVDIGGAMDRIGIS